MFDLPMLNIDARFYCFELKEFEYLYQLKQGKCARSLGILCASKAGCPSSMIQRASVISDAINNGEPIPPLEPLTKRNEAAKVIIKEFVEFDLDGDLEVGIWRRLRALQNLFK